MSKSIFTKIINRELPATIQYEDEEFIAINDISPAAPVHVLIIPKQEFKTLEEVNQADIQFHASLLLIARKIAHQLGIADNYKLVMNVGTQVQQVQHIHLHLLGGWSKDKTAADLDNSTEKL